MKQNKTAVIVAGGKRNREFIRTFFEKNRFDIKIAADTGMEFFYDAQIKPTHIVGDFDSVNPQILMKFQKQPDICFREFQAEKDLTDTEIAIDLAIEAGADDILILGATGGRLDHTLAAIQCMEKALEAGVTCCLLDEQNAIHLAGAVQTKEQVEIFIEKQNQYGTYVSLLPLTTEVKGLTLRGFKYPLTDYTLTSFNSLGVSNEIAEAAGTISFDEGILIVIESKDGGD